MKPKYAVYVPHTAGRYQTKRFRKAQCPIVERLTNSLMMHGRNNGKKMLAVRIVRHALEARARLCLCQCRHFRLLPDHRSCSHHTDRASPGRPEPHPGCNLRTSQSRAALAVALAFI